MRCATVGSGTRKARAISSVVRPPISRSVSATRASGDSTGWQAVKMRPQQIVADVVVERGIDVGHRMRLLDLHVVADFVVLAVEHLGAAQMVDGAAFARRHQPGGGIVRHAFFRPLVECRDQRVLREFLGQADVAHHARDRGDDLRLLDPPDRFDGL